MSSSWVNFRNSIEAIFDPEIAAATSFGKALLDDAELVAKNNITTAFDNAAKVFMETAGTVETRALAAIAEFGSILIGAEISIIKKDAAAAIEGSNATTTTGA